MTARQHVGFEGYLLAVLAARRPRSVRQTESGGFRSPRSQPLAIATSTGGSIVLDQAFPPTRCEWYSSNPMARNRRPKRKQPVRQTPQVALGRRAIGWFQTIPGIVTSVTTVVAAPVGLYVAITPTLTMPTFSARDPFLLPFTVRAGWLGMSNITWTCNIINARAGQGLTMKDVSISNRSSSNIGRHGIANFTCPIRNLSQTTVAVVNLTLTYKTLGYPRELTGEFSWLAGATPPRWIEGRYP